MKHTIYGGLAALFLGTVLFGQSATDAKRVISVKTEDGQSTVIEMEGGHVVRVNGSMVLTEVHESRNARTRSLKKARNGKKAKTITLFGEVNEAPGTTLLIETSTAPQSAPGQAANCEAKSSCCGSCEKSKVSKKKSGCEGCSGQKASNEGSGCGGGKAAQASSECCGQCDGGKAKKKTTGSFFLAPGKHSIKKKGGNVFVLESDKNEQYTFEPSENAFTFAVPEGDLDFSELQKKLSQIQGDKGLRIFAGEAPKALLRWTQEKPGKNLDLKTLLGDLSQNIERDLEIDLGDICPAFEGIEIDIDIDIDVDCDEDDEDCCGGKGCEEGCCKDEDCCDGKGCEEGCCEADHDEDEGHDSRSARVRPDLGARPTPKRLRALAVEARHKARIARKLAMEERRKARQDLRKKQSDRRKAAPRPRRNKAPRSSRKERRDTRIEWRQSGADRRPEIREERRRSAPRPERRGQLNDRRREMKAEIRKLEEMLRELENKLSERPSKKRDARRERPDVFKKARRI